MRYSIKRFETIEERIEELEEELDELQKNYSDAEEEFGKDEADDMYGSDIAECERLLDEYGSELYAMEIYALERDYYASVL